MIEAHNASFRVVTDYKETDQEFTGCDVSISEGVLVITPSGDDEPWMWYAKGSWNVVDFKHRNDDPR